MEQHLSLWLDYYDDVFSDFDSRKYHKRRLSEDFLTELRAALQHKNGHFDKLVLLLPPEQRNAQIEKDIIPSLKERFAELQRIYRRKERLVLRKAIALLATGIILMAVNSVIIYKGYRGYVIAIFGVLMEPASWFLVWTGLDGLFYDFRMAKKETDFYKAIGQMEICFNDI